jgi:hypothetical protein
VQPDSPIAPNSNLGSESEPEDSDRTQTHGIRDASPTGNGDSGARLMAEGGLDKGPDVLGLLSGEGLTRNSVTAPSDASCAASVPSLDPSSSDSWFAPWLSCFLTISDDISWRDLVRNWLKFETQGVLEGVSLHFLPAYRVV